MKLCLLSPVPILLPISQFAGGSTVRGKENKLFCSYFLHTWHHFTSLFHALPPNHLFSKLKASHIEKMLQPLDHLHQDNIIFYARSRLALPPSPVSGADSGVGVLGDAPVCCVLWPALRRLNSVLCGCESSVWVDGLPVSLRTF